MRVRAPGKVLLSGAYAVLEGAPAVVMAVDRYAVADATTRAAEPSREVLAAMPRANAPEVDVTSLQKDGHKLGLGSSAATLVASLGARAALCGEDLGDPAVRRRLFEAARSAHAEAQGGGSGVDVAASVHGGVLRYAIGQEVATPLALPNSLHVAVFWSGESARTSELLARVEAFRRRDLRAHAARMGELGEASVRAVRALSSGDGASFVEAGRYTEEALVELGRAADAPIVPDRFATLARAARSEHASFFPSGAGGGDVAVFLGMQPPSDAFLTKARAERMFLLPLRLDRGGVRLVD